MDDDDFESGIIQSKSIVVCPQFLHDIMGSDDECTTTPVRKSYSELKELVSEQTPSKYNKNIVALSPDFKKVFLKEIKKEPMSDPAWGIQVQKQFEIHPTLDHQNIIKVIDHNYELGTIILEFMNESQYFQKLIIDQAKPINNELKLRSYIIDIAEGLKYLHERDLVHMDIRLETLHCSRTPNDIVRTVKIGDFGNIQRKDDVLTKFHYDFIKLRQHMLPPELKVGSLAHPSMDIWCFGIVIHMMIVAYPPSILPQNQNNTQKVHFNKVHWKTHDLQLFELAKQMLHMDPLQRPTAEQILQTPCLK